MRRMTPVLVLACTLAACSDSGTHAHDHGDHDHDPDDHAGHGHAEDGHAVLEQTAGESVTLDESSALAEFLLNNNIRDEAGWMRVDIAHSDITGGPRRVFADKYAVGEALLGWAGVDESGAPAPLAYAPGAVFVAENLDDIGGVVSTFVIQFDDDGAPTFRAFDARGHESDETPIAHAAATGSTPSDCRACHLGEQVFAPMSAFPHEEERVALEVDPRVRDAERVALFSESFTRGSGVFGPYGGLLLSTYAADVRDDKLTKYDQYGMFVLAQRYAEELGLPPMQFGDGDGEGEDR